MEFNKTERGQRKLLRNGYMYVHKRNLLEGSSMWQRIYWQKGYQYHVKVKLSSLAKFLDEIHEHTHALSQTEFQVKLKVESKDEMKNQKKQHGKCKAQSYKIFLMELRQTYHL